MRSGLRALDPDAGPESPEALVISALLDSGSFIPSKHSISSEDLACYRGLWEFALAYQSQTGHAPGRELVAAKYPDFEHIADVNLDWAVGQLRRASKGREVRRRISVGITALREDDLETAIGAFDGLTRPRGKAKAGMSILDDATIIDAEDLRTLPVPWQTCGRATGGIGPSQLWYIAARLGQGKTFTMINFGVHAAKAGARVRYISLEMRARVINRRAQLALAGRDIKLRRMLIDESPGIRKDALEILTARMPGSFDVIDTSHGRVNISVVADAMADADLVIVDHIGLMSTNSGNRAIEDWRTMATISNQLKEETLLTGVPVLAAAQINREGDHSGHRPPKVSQLSQSDALGQDGDVVITFKQLGKKVLHFSAEKVREGQNGRWYAAFEPDKGLFNEISKELALERSCMDDDELQAI